MGGEQVGIQWKGSSLSEAGKKTQGDGSNNQKEILQEKRVAG